LEEVVAFCAVRISVFRKADFELQNLAWLKPLVGLREPAESLHGQSCTDEQDQCESDLRRDQSVAQAPTRRSGGGAPGFFEYGIQIDVTQVQRGGEAKDQSQEQREKNRREEYGGVNPNAIPAGNPLGPVGRNAVAKEAHARKRRGDRDGSSEKCKQRHFRDQEASQPGAICAQRGAHGKLSLAGNHPCEEEIREIGAREKQNEHSSGLEQQEERQSVEIKFLAKLQDIQNETCVGFRVEFGKPPRESVERCRSLSNGDVRLQPRESRKRQLGAVRFLRGSKR
jgi:hypothetical protein